MIPIALNGRMDQQPAIVEEKGPTISPNDYSGQDTKVKRTGTKWKENTDICSMRKLCVCELDLLTTHLTQTD